MGRRRVGIVVFPEVEVLDVCGPYEVLAVTRLDEARRREEPSPFEVLLVGPEAGPIPGTGGFTFTADVGRADCPTLDVLVVPGGWGTRAAIHDAALLEWIAARAAAVETVASVCTGAMLLGHAGLLRGRRATTHWRSLDWMAAAFPDTTVERALHVVEDGALLTSAGISAGIDLALRLVARCHGEAVARATARQMEYPYPDDLRRRV